MENKQLNIFDWMQESMSNTQAYDDAVKEKFPRQTRKQRNAFDNQVRRMLGEESFLFDEILKTEEFKKMSTAEELLKGLNGINSDTDQFKMRFDINNNIAGFHTSGKNRVDVDIKDFVKKTKNLDISKAISKYKAPLAIGGLVLGGMALHELIDKD